MFFFVFVGCAALLHGIDGKAAQLSPFYSTANDIDKVWTQWLTSPPAIPVQAAENLTERADKLAVQLSNTTLNVTGALDVVVSGGGNLDAYFLGGYMILRRVQEMGKLNISRFAGASAGGMMPFELLLKGENSTLVEHLSYGFLEQTFPKSFANMLEAAATQDHHWRIMAKWMVTTFAQKLSSLDDRVFLALSCLDPLTKLVIVSKFTSPTQAEHAFMATGTFFEEYDGMPCSDGGAMSGPRMTPLFQDHARNQLVVDLMRTGRPTTQVSRINMTQYKTLVELGQDEMVRFLQVGTCREDAISLCPAKSNVKTMVCKNSRL